MGFFCYKWIRLSILQIMGLKIDSGAFPNEICIEYPVGNYILENIKNLFINQYIFLDKLSKVE